MKAADFVATGRPHLARVKHFPSVEFADYERRLAAMQETLQLIQQSYLGTTHRAVIVLEGWDTAGKGGVVRRLGWALDPRSFKVHAITAPNEREKHLHYLQRFWEHLPQHGQIVVFDRSWYGRVLVERVEGFATEHEWHRAYEEINGFEQMLLADDMRVVKLFLHITPQEQLRRFRARLTDPLKRWKLSYEDFRNRGRWQDYEAAIEEMVEKTSTRRARGTSFLPTISRSAGSLLCASSLIGFPKGCAWSRGRWNQRSRKPPSGCSAFVCRPIITHIRARSLACIALYLRSSGRGLPLRDVPADFRAFRQSACLIVEAQYRHLGRGGQDLAERMHPLPGIVAPELIELVQIPHLDLELQRCAAVATSERYQQARPQVPCARRLDLSLNEFHRPLTVHWQDVIGKPCKVHWVSPRWVPIGPTRLAG